MACLFIFVPFHPQQTAEVNGKEEWLMTEQFLCKSLNGSLSIV